MQRYLQIRITTSVPPFIFIVIFRIQSNTSDKAFWRKYLTAKTERAENAQKTLLTPSERFMHVQY